jgi:DUF4097 and DUF4098 domain-containing protein YvlB
MRARFVVLTATLLIPAGAGLAAAGPLSQSADVHRVITGRVTSVVVDGDVSSVSVVPGRTTSVSAHLEWVKQRPDLTITLAKGKLTVKARCREEIAAGPAVWISGVTNCADDLELVVPAAAPLSVTSYGPANVSGLVGTVDITGATGVKVSQIRSSRVRLRAYGDVVAQHLVASVADLRTTTGSVTASSVSGRLVTLDSGYGSVQGTDLAARTLILRTDQGAVDLDAARADAVDASSGYGNVDVSRLRSPDVSAVTDQGRVAVDQVVGRRLVAKSSYGNIEVSNVSGSDLTASTSQGSVTLEKIRGRQLSVKSGYGDIEASRVTGTQLSARSEQGSVQVSDIAAAVDAESGQGDVIVQRVRGPEVTARSSYGAVAVDDVHVARISATSAQGKVSVSDLDAPSLVRATSGYGDVDVTVPAGRYAVDVSSSNGKSSVDGLVVDRAARRQIVATTAEGDVTVQGV